jgi:tetraacyldisaccharide 4'-kinase
MTDSVTPMRTLLLPFSWGYALATTVRNLAFDCGAFHSRRATIPVISVGNMTAGGTGKTPLVEYLLPLLTGGGFHPAVVSRGYGRSSHGVVAVACRGALLANARNGGDEPVQIAAKFPGVTVVVGERRYEAVEVAVRECGADVALLDDGFQHRWLRRDLDIVVLDARKNIFKETFLPAGMKRERLKGLHRADIIGLSHAPAEVDVPWISALERWFDGPVFSFDTEIDGFYRWAEGVPVPARVTPHQGLFAFSGISAHSDFLESLAKAGCALVGDKAFGDHHIFTKMDVRRVLDAANAVRAEGCITTEKDMIRLSADRELWNMLRGAIHMYHVSISVRMVRGAGVLENALDDFLRGRRD